MVEGTSVVVNVMLSLMSVMRPPPALCKSLVWVEVLCWINRVWSSKECVCCACDPSVNLDVISGDDVCCSVVFGTLVGVFVFSVMWSELLMASACAL